MVKVRILGGNNAKMVKVIVLPLKNTNRSHSEGWKKGEEGKEEVGCCEFGYAGHLMKCLTLVSRFFRILSSDTSAMGHFRMLLEGL